MKKRVYFFESNIPMDKVVYLPLVSGILQAYAQSFPVLNEAYEFMPYIFMRDTPENMIKDIEDPYLMGFSVCIWNHQLSLAVAKLVKQRWPHCIIVFGGPQVLADDKARYDFIDIIVQEEGEKKFVKILADLIHETIDLSQHTLKDYPSPYTLGLYEKTIQDHPDIVFQAIVETNRGCPFTCSFCVDANTEVATLYGNKKIVNLEICDKILGWDEEKKEYVWNDFLKCIYTGQQEVFRVESEDCYVEATKDHKIYTKEGWKKVGELSSSDFVSISYKVSPNEIKQSDEEIRGSGETSENSERKNSKGGNCSVHVHYSGSENNEQNGQRKTIWPKQSNERFGNSKENGCHEKVSSFSDNFRIYDSQQSNAQFNFERESKICFEQQRNSKSVFKELTKASEFVRSYCSKFLTRTQFSFSIYWKCWIMDWPLCFGNIEESRFCSYRQENQENNIGSWSILAFFQSCSNRIKRLRQSRLEMFDYLGYRQTRSYNGEQDKNFCWQKVKSIRSVGIRPVYDLINVTPSQNFFANGILVHNCYWGQGFEEKKVRHHTLDHVREEAEWLGRNKIKYVFMADANFGMYDRDYEVAKIYCETKARYGYPDKVRVCYGKNKEDNVFKVATLMHSYDLTKAVTLARQSNDEETLKNIRRANIKLSVYDKLRDRYNDAGIPTYTEIILGMPGEKKESFIKGVDEIAGTPTQLFIYHCTLLPNTEMFDPAYIAKHGIRTVRVPLAEIHCQFRHPDYIQEYEDIIIETSSMSVNEWIHCAVYAWMTQLEHVFGVEDIPGWVHDYFYRIAVGITQGTARAQFDPGYGNIYWEPEEMAYLIVCMSRGEILEDPKEFARKNVLWGRKSRVHGNKKTEPQNIIDRRPYLAPELAEVMKFYDS